MRTLVELCGHLGTFATFVLAVNLFLLTRNGRYAGLQGLRYVALAALVQVAVLSVWDVLYAAEVLSLDTYSMGRRATGRWLLALPPGLVTWWLMRRSAAP